MMPLNLEIIRKHMKKILPSFKFQTWFMPTKSLHQVLPKALIQRYLKNVSPTLKTFNRPKEKSKQALKIFFRYSKFSLSLKLLRNFGERWCKFLASKKIFICDRKF